MNILFICKYNIFRSKGAEALFKKYNKNKKIKVKSAGLITGYKNHPNFNKAGKKFGIEIKGESINLNKDLFRWHDVIVLVADDVPLQFFSTIESVKKVIHWKIEDAEKETISARVAVLENIDKKIKKLVKEFN